MVHVSREKKTPQNPPDLSLREEEPVVSAVRPIRLKPSSSDYVTFVRTTAKAMGKTEPTASDLKPNPRVLWLANLES